MFCAQCGTANPPEYQFCKNCGVSLPRAATASPSQPAAAAPPPGYPAYPGYPGAPQVVYYTNPQAAAQAHTTLQQNLLRSLRGRLQAIASTEDLQGFSLAEMFSEVFKRRSPVEVEDYLLVGTSKTTPPIDVVQTGWPKPWLFFRVLAVMVVAYVALTYTLLNLPGTGNLIPPILFVGSFAVPLATLTFFFEMNTPRNVSVQRIVTLGFLGAVVALAFALFGYNLPFLSNQNASLLAAGVVEECAKLATVIIVIRNLKYKYILNGLLFGATVGAGFAAFETSGYGLNDGLLAGMHLAYQHGAAAQAMQVGVSVMLSVLKTRAWMTPFGHVAWTAIAAGALWRVKKDQKFRFSMLTDPRFFKAFMIPVALHTIWDFPYYQLPYDGNVIISAVIGWYVVFGLVQQGLRQVQDEQRTHLQTTLSHVEASLEAAPDVAAS